jgi:uncharacterized protein (TIGR02679 family)
LVISTRPVSVAAVGPERVAIAGLLGLSPVGDEALRIRPDRLDQVLRDGAAAIGLVDLLTELGGPLVDRTALRRSATEAREETWAWLAGHPATAEHPSLGRWLSGARATGLALRLAGSADRVRDLVGAALDILLRLPAADLPLAVLASEATGDAHALDRHRSLGTLVASALPGIDVEIDAVDDGDDRHWMDAGGVADPTELGGAAEWRRRWARVGVVCDDLSVSVLALNLPAADGDDLVMSLLGDHRRAGEPVRLTLHQLERGALMIEPGTTVRLCENPTVVRAALALGSACAPLVCTDGQPNSAVDHLIHRCVASGATVLHHGDFDWGGLRIANTLVTRHGVGVWRFGTDDYLAAASMGGVVSGLDPVPQGAAAPWDPELVPTMHRMGARIYEEQVLDTLLTDLETDRPHRV